MKFRLPGFLRSRKEQSTVALVELTMGLVEGAFVPIEVHEARVKELLLASNVEMERRRRAEREARDAEMQTLRAARFARQNLGIVKAVDWVQSTDSIGGGESLAMACIAAFVAGFVGAAQLSTGPASDMAYQAGQAAKRSDIALTSAAQSVGIKEIV